MFEDLKGAKYAAQIVLQSEQPLDARSVVDSYSDLQSLVDEHGAYEGMIVYVKEKKLPYLYDGEYWKQIIDADITWNAKDGLNSVGNAYFAGIEEAFREIYETTLLALQTADKLDISTDDEIAEIVAEVFG